MGKQEEREKRLLRWRHCGFLGSVAMARTSFLVAEKAPTVTPAARAQIKIVLAELDKLAVLLKERNDG